MLTYNKKIIQNTQSTLREHDCWNGVFAFGLQESQWNLRNGYSLDIFTILKSIILLEWVGIYNPRPAPLHDLTNALKANDPYGNLPTYSVETSPKSTPLISLILEGRFWRVFFVTYHVFFQLSWAFTNGVCLLFGYRHLLVGQRNRFQHPFRRRTEFSKNWHCPFIT